MPAQIAIQIVTFNSQDVIEHCLHSIDAQLNVEFELYIIDNASQDDTIEIIRKLGHKVISNLNNIGYAAAHNQALKLSNADYILTLNPDVWLAPDFLQNALQELEKHPEAGAANALLLRVDTFKNSPETIDSAGLFMRRNRRQGLLLEGQSIRRLPKSVVPIFGPDGAAAIYRRTMLEDIAINGEVFDEDFFMHKEDVDLCWRAHIAGWKAILIPSATAHHIRTFRPGQRQNISDDLKYYGLRNRYFLMMKNEFLSHFIMSVIPILLYELVIITYLVLKEPSGFKAIYDAYRLRHLILDKRTHVQAKCRGDKKTIKHWFRGEYDIE